MVSRPGDTTERVVSGGMRPSKGRDLAIAWTVDSAPAGFQILRGARLTIGRTEDADLRLEHPSVSRQHAELHREGPVYALRDCDSANGTWVDGERIEHRAVSPGNVLRFGDCIGVVVSIEAGADHCDFEALAPGLWGGPTLAAAIAKGRTAARSDLPIVIVGETGTGKERVARALHHWSGRPGPFNAINCSTVPAPLAEAELFGHQRGAFTGADRARGGHFQAADGGTLFLDEIEDLSPEVQAKLLRVVELGEAMPLGGTRATHVDVRIIAAAHERLDALVQRERFRADLAARLAGFVVEVPPLRRRREEIPGLFLHFLEKHADGPAPRVESALFEWLCLRDWPGNVRELELMARKLLALHADETVLCSSFAEALCERASPSRARSAPSERPVSGRRLVFRDRRDSDLHRLRCALEQTEGNLKAAAERIGISRRRAYRLIGTAKSERSDD
jgi:transcriptional regulator of acetoin/glycerol metabolism